MSSMTTFKARSIVKDKDKEKDTKNDIDSSLIELKNSTCVANNHQDRKTTINNENGRRQSPNHVENVLKATSDQQQQPTPCSDGQRSPYWSSEEGSATSSHQPADTGSSSSEDTMHSQNQPSQKKIKRSKLRFNPPIGEEVFHDDDNDDDYDSSFGWEQEDENPLRHKQLKYHGLPEFPSLHFPKPQGSPETSPSTLTANTKKTRTLRTNSLLPQQLSLADIEICQRLDLEYERALEEREIGYNARYQSVRQSAAFILLFMILLLACGTAFFTLVAGWDIHNALFFSIYTMTTVGYGLNDNIPNRTYFLLFIMVFIFLGIATLTIMVAQVYQCIALEATRAQHVRDRAEMSRKGHVVILNRTKQHQQLQQRVSSNSLLLMQELEAAASREKPWEHVVRFYEKTKHYFRESEIGKGLSVVFPFAGLIIIGAAVVGPMEGWTIIESLYFACVSLTTVGYGLYVPQNRIAIYFCIFWLPFSVGFMSLYLSNVASFYIRLSDTNIHRLEKQMRRRIKRAKQNARRSRLAHSKTTSVSGRATKPSPTAAAPLGSDDSPEKLIHSTRGFERLSVGDDESPPLSGGSATELGELRRSQILANSHVSKRDEVVGGQTMQTMRDIIRTVKHNVNVNPLYQGQNELPNGSTTVGADKHGSPSFRSLESQFMTIHSSQEFSTLSPRRSDVVQHKPAFALRVLVQERFAEIVATDIAGFQSHIEIKENTLSVTINTLKEAADKWMVPRRARKAFRSVAFEALYFVGEHGLITRGADALFDLTPFEFHGLFSPLVAAMGDANVMEGWLAATDVLADVDLRRDGGSGLRATREYGGMENRIPTLTGVPIITTSVSERKREDKEEVDHRNDNSMDKGEEQVSPNGQIELATLT